MTSHGVVEQSSQRVGIVSLQARVRMTSIYGCAYKCSVSCHQAECLRAAETGAEKARGEMREIISALHVEKAALSPVREGGGRAAPSPGRSPTSTGRASPKAAGSPTSVGHGSPKGSGARTWNGPSQSPKLWEYLGPKVGSEGRGKGSAPSSPRGTASLSRGTATGKFVAPTLGECRAKALRRLAAILRWVKLKGQFVELCEIGLTTACNMELPR